MLCTSMKGKKEKSYIVFKSASKSTNSKIYKEVKKFEEEFDNVVCGIQSQRMVR